MLINWNCHCFSSFLMSFCKWWSNLQCCDVINVEKVQRFGQEKKNYSTMKNEWFTKTRSCSGMIDSRMKSWVDIITLSKRIVGNWIQERRRLKTADAESVNGSNTFVRIEGNLGTRNRGKSKEVIAKFNAPLILHNFFTLFHKRVF